MADYTLSNFRNYTTFTDQTGSAIYDSGGPTGSYPAGDNYYFIIAPSYSTGSLIVAVESASFASTDKIRIYDGVPTKGTTGSFSYTGTTINSQLIGILTGTFGTPRYFTASSGRAYVRFSGDTAGTFGGAAGFKLSWTGSNFYTPSFYGSTLVNNQYGVTFPADGTSGSYMTFARGKLSSSSTLDFNKDIIVGFWAKQDTLPASAPEGPVLSVGPYNGGTGFAISRAGSPSPGDNSFRIFYNDISGNISATTLRATDIVNGGQLSLFTYPPQWNHYGFVIRKTGVNTGEYLTYKDGVLFSTASITKATSWGYITSAYDIVLGSYRDFTTGLVLSGGASKSTWSGSLDDVFLAAATTGSAKTEYSTFFNRIYNSGNWSNPNVEITGALSASLNPVVIFNWRFEETGSMLNTIDYGAYGNLHSASTVGNIANSSVRLTFTSSGVSYTPYASLSYSGSNATITFVTSSDSVYENTASYYVGIRASIAAIGQSATASISTSSFNATAVLGTDYKLIYGGTTYSSSAQLPVFVSWPASDTSIKYITASIIDNTTYTGTSSSFALLINAANSTNVITGSPAFFTLKILDYEEGNPSFTSASYATGEASSSITFYTDRLSGSQGPLSVNYSTKDGTAVSGTNYTRTTGTFSWADGNTSRLSASIPILYDNVQTSNLNFSICLFNLSTGSFLPYAITSSTITIADQEPGTFNWSSTTLTAYETGSLATINVNRISGTYGAVTLNISGSSSLGQPLRTTMTGTLSFADGDASKQFTINIQDDLIDESDDIIYYRLYPTSSVGGATAFTGSSGLLAFTLIDNETGSITFNKSTDSVYENTSSYIFNVQRLYGGDQVETASISYTSTAIENTNYNVIYNGVTKTSPFNITWSGTDTATKYITASIYDNQTSASTKTVSFSIASSSISSIGPSASFVLSILDYEEGYPSFTSASYSTGEASGSITFYADRLSGSQGPLSVNYSTTDGTAVSGTNYTKITGTFSWADGVTTRQSTNIPILYDGVQTSNLNFTINLFGLSTGSFSNYPNAITSSTITIVDQEPGTLKISSSSYSIIEGQSFSVSVGRYSGSFGLVAVNLTSSNGTAVSGTDYVAVNQNLTFADGETLKSFSISTIENITDVTGSLYFNFGINTISSSYGTSFKGSPSLAQVNIIDNETGSVRFTTASYTGSFGSLITIPVERYLAADFTATVSIGVSGGTAVAGVDYTNIFPYTVTWADQVSGTVNISLQTLSTNVWGGSKTLTLTASNLTNIGVGSIMTASILFSSQVIEKSEQPYENYNKSYVIYDYGNISSQFRRTIKQVPFSLEKKGTGILRKP